MSRVLIIGAGPAGLTTAIQLARYGIQVDVFEKAAELAPESRALGLQSRTLEVLDMLGAAEETLAKGKILRGFSIHSGAEMVGRLPLHVTHSRTPYPVEIVLAQSETVRILYRRLQSLGGEVQFQTEVKHVAAQPEAVRVSYLRESGSIESAAYDWVIGSDGASSVVRHCLAVPFQGVEYPEDFLLADAFLDWDLAPDDAHLFFRPQGPIVTFPYPEAGLWRLVDTSGDFKNADPQAVALHFQQVLDGLGMRVRLHDPRWTSLFRIHRRLVAEYRHGRCFLIGDAAHIHSPASGQGLNTGLQDGFNLGWKLAAVLNGQAPESILDSVTPERRPVAEDVLKSSDKITEGILMRNQVGEKVRDLMIQSALHVPAIRSRMVEGVSKLDMSYSGSPLNGASIHHDKAIQPGDRAPNLLPGSTLLAAKDKMLPALRSGKWLLLAFTGTPRNGENAIEFFRQHRLPADYPNLESYLVKGPGSTVAGELDSIASITDFDGEMHADYGVTEPSLFLIRPDGYLAYCSDNRSFGELVSYLQRNLRSKPAETSDSVVLPQ